jgi:hypothetical protein
MLKEKILHNASNTDLAHQFNLSERQVEKTLSWAKKAELLVGLEDQVLQEIVPLATEAIKSALRSDNVKVASDVAIRVFEATVPSFKKGGAAGTSGAPADNDIESYIARLRDEASLGSGPENGPVPALPPGPSPVDAEILPDGAAIDDGPSGSAAANLPDLSPGTGLPAQDPGVSILDLLTSE